MTQTPIGRIINRSAREADRGAVFAAQFALSHACWLVTDPLAGWIGAGAGLSAAALALAGIGAAGLVAVLRLWPADDPDAFEHSHENLPLDHPHLIGQRHHTHRFVVDDVDLPGKRGERQLRNQEMFHGKREQTDARVSA
ncbi:MAG: hypothetical protein U5N10_05320 [Gemmobacter sp.]|nr:hypothetical protein [Gemmobacter sp.]